MSEEFKIDVEWLEGSDQDPIERSSFALVVISAAQKVATELEDLLARTTRLGPRASAYDLAMWFAENWWRLRWEPVERTADWRLSHVVAAVNGGVAWPNVSFASDGVHILIEARQTDGGGGAPVRYISDVDVQIGAMAFEQGINEFVECVLARLSSLGVGETDLGSLWRQVLAERQDQELSGRRRLEALLGFDPDEAPEELIAALRETTEEAGSGAVDEVAAATKSQASETLRQVMDRTRRSDLSIRVPSASDIFSQFSGKYDPTELPWQRAKWAAKSVRSVWDVADGPVSDKALATLLDVPERVLEYAPSNGLPVAAGLRSEYGAERVNVVMRAKPPTGRRFEIMRLVADHILAPSDDRLLPATRARTDRQKFQRAFAQEFLLPFEELYNRLGRPQPVENEISDDEIDDVAQEYHVSPLLVRTTLVNQGILPRDELLVGASRTAMTG